MVSLGYPSFPPTGLGRQEDEEASPGVPRERHLVLNTMKAKSKSYKLQVESDVLVIRTNNSSFYMSTTKIQEILTVSDDIIIPNASTS
ncbi:hypothetical protein TNCV_4029861 [Trichonephila clavipes]|nr:hypothetical protein TNCV_4029861 [Trichonephila clavipes]